jgi:hypothetical protein
MFSPAADCLHLIEEFRRQPFGPHSPALQALLTWLRTRPRARKIVLYREPDGRRLRLCELGGDPLRLTALAPEPLATLEDAERAAFAIRWRENCPDLPLPGGGGR